jgi:hypothetical protein
MRDYAPAPSTTSPKRWTFELAQVWNRSLVWGQPNAWQEAVYSEVFAPYARFDSPPYDDLALTIGESEVMELHNVGARIIPQVNCMREQAVAELFGLDEDESSEGEYWTMDGVSGYTARHVPAGWTWTIFWGWAEAPGVYGCLTCQGVGGHFGGCPQRGAA